MMEIRAESTKFNTSLRIADQARMILKKSLFTDLNMLEKWGKVSLKEYAQEELSTRTETAKHLRKY